MTKTILGRYGNDRGHWVGDGFPVRSLFSYNSLGAAHQPVPAARLCRPALVRADRASGAASASIRIAASRR